MQPDASNQGSHTGNGIGPNSPDIGLPSGRYNPLPQTVLVALGAMNRIGPKKEWNTSILRAATFEPVVTSPENRYYLEPRAPTAREIYDHFIETQQKLGCLVDRRNSEVYKKVYDSFLWIAQRAGIDPETFEVDILRSPEENAFILHHNDIAKPHIFITTGFLEKLESRYGRLRAGHIRFIFGHEIAHWKEGHYDQLKRQKSTVPGEDPIRVRQIYSNFSFDGAKDYFLSLVFTRDQELVADDHSIRWCAERIKGQPEPNPLDALQVLDFMAESALAEKQLHYRDASRTRRRFPLLSWAGTKLTSTHPASEGRAARGRGALRQIEVEKSARDSSGVITRRWQPSDVIGGLAQDSQIRKTPVQELLSELNRVIHTARAKEGFPFQEIEAFVRSRTGNYSAENYDQAVEEIKHLMVLLPALYRVRQGCLPFEPYGVLKKVPPDQAQNSLVQNLIGDHARSLEAIVNHLGDTMEDLRVARQDALSTLGPSAAYAKIEVDFKAWIACFGMYGSKEVEKRLLDRNVGILDQLRMDPNLAIRLLKDHGDQFFDFRAFSNEWIRPMLESGIEEVYERGSWFASLAQTEHCDLRGVIFRIFLENDLLLGATSLDGILDFVGKADEAFKNEPMWERGGTAAMLGSEVVQWLEAKSPPNKPRQVPELVQALCKLRDRNSLTPDGVDFVVLEILPFFLKGKPNDFTSRRDWLVDIFPAGKMRDLALCKLLEAETGIFDHFYESHYRDPLSAINRSKDLPDDSTELLSPARAKRYVKCFLELVHLFDCGWFKTELARGDMAKITLPPPESEAPAPFAFTDSPFHSSLLDKFSTAHYYQMMGPNTPEANILRYYFRPFIESFLAHAMKSEIKGLPPVSPQEFFEVISRGGLLRTIPDLPPAREFPFVFNDLHWSASNKVQQGDHPEAVMFPVADKMENSGPENPSSVMRAALLTQGTFPGREIKSLRGLHLAMCQLPPGEFRDYLILRDLARQVEQASLNTAVEQGRAAANTIGENSRVLSEETEHLVSLRDRTNIGLARFFLEDDHDILKRGLEPIKQLLGLLRGARDETNNPGLRVSTTSSERAHRFEVIRRVYEDYSLYLKFRSGMYLHGFKMPEAEVEFYNLQDVATEVSRMAFEGYYCIPENLAKFQACSPAQKLDEIVSLFIYPSPERDAHILRIFREEEKLNGKSENPHCSDLAKRIYALLYSPYHRADLGQRIYKARLAADPAIKTDFDRHLELILSTHPDGSVRRERTLKGFFDGETGKNKGVARTWEHRDRINAILDAEKATSADDSKLLRKGGVQFLEAALNELNISAKERVDTILWMAGLREKSHLVNCYEVVEGKSTSGLKDEVDKLTDDEKKLFIRAVLVGPQGILRSDDYSAKKEFLDTLFFSVFHNAAQKRDEQQVRYFKAVYDTMLGHIEPERAADFLGNFLVSHLEGKNFNQQVKVFFESFGFVGVKTAQYLVSSTTMIPEEMKDVLMDLTSRVEGPDKRFVFDLAEKIYGPDARKIIKEIGDRVGGGSLMSFYEVTLHDGRQGVIGVLRPDIVHALPEDILLVHRLIETMQESPEIFGGKVISSDLMENLMWMSLVETNLGRTARLQEKMRKQIQDLTGEIPVLVPEVWTRHMVADADGQQRVVGLNQGPFIFMQHARGVTLDLFLDQLSADPDGDQKRKSVMNRIAGVFLDQLTQHGLVHCDLHPGNILVYEENGKIEVTFLDIGLSTELDKDVTTALHRYLRLGIGHTDFSGERASIEKAVKKFLGIGEVEETKARKWIRWTLDVFESELGDFWDNELKERATDVILRVMTDPDTKVQTKLAQIMDLTKDLGLVFPRQFYYILRAVSVMDYVWADVDWGEQARRIQRLKSDEDPIESLSDLNIDLICEKVALVAERVDVNIDLVRVRTILEEANREQRLDRRVMRIRDGMFSVVEEAKGNAEELLRSLLQDQELREQLNLDEAVRKTRAFFDLQRAQRKKSAESEFGFLAAEPLPKGTAREIAQARSFGRLSPIWRMNFYPGTMIRIVRGQQPPVIVQSFVVLGHNQLHEPIDGLELGVFEQTTDAPAMEILSRMILGDFDVLDNISLDQEWAESARTYDTHLKRIKGKSGKTNGAADSDIVPPGVVEEEEPQASAFAEDSSAGAFGVYTNFIEQIEHTKFREITTLSKILRATSDRVEILHGNEWCPIEDCMFEKGETEVEYNAYLRQERIRLGLPTLMQY